MIELPNLITLLRLLLVPMMAYFLVNERYEVALPIFLVAALSDFADGYIARRFKIESKFGATLDPIADKLNMTVATVLLAWQALMPIWLAIAIVGRDVLIVAGALAFRLAFGHLEVAPTLLSKVNTALEFALLLLLMAVGAGYIDGGDWMPVAFVTVLTTVVASVGHYGWLLARKVSKETRAR
jgi:cardiolipin synthase